VLEALYQAREQKVAHAIGITCHADPVALQTALERHDFDCTQMALNAGLARMADVPGGFKATLMGAGSFERLALPVATRKKMGVIAMKVFGQEQLLGAAPADKLLTYALPMNLQNTTFVTPCTAARCKEWLFLTTSLGSGAQSASKCRGILSLPISLASVGMPRLEHIESNAALARAFKPMSTRQRQQLEESIESSRKLAMQHFFADHQDV
jgi:predicted aldo/keto reductase-like oxidoreductase